MPTCPCCGQEMLIASQDRFEDFWKVWPVGRKVEKVRCEKKWKKDKLDAVADKIIADVNHRKSTDASWKAGYIPNPYRYLDYRRWNDDIQEDKPEIKKPVTNKEWEELGRIHKVKPGIGESWPKFKERVWEAVNAGG